MTEIVPLATNDDWLRCRAPFEAMEGLCPPSPWATWDYANAVWRTFHPGTRCWLMTCGEDDRWTGAALWRQSVERRRWFHLEVLRSLDEMVLRIPPVLATAGHEEECADALTGGLRDLRRLTRADVVTLYRLDKSASSWWVQALRQRGVPVRERLFTLSPRLTLGDDLDGYLRTLQQSWLSRIHRRDRKLAREKGEVRLQVVTGRGWEDPALQAAWREFEALRSKTWQYEWADESGRADNALLTGFYRAVGESWARRGWLELALLYAGATAVAFGVNLHVGGRMWKYLMGYDQEYRGYGPGNMLFLKELETVHARGVRAIEFGGEALDWKHRWTAEEEELLALEWPLGGWKGRLWGLARRPEAAETTPMRSAADNAL